MLSPQRKACREPRKGPAPAGGVGLAPPLPLCLAPATPSAMFLLELCSGGLAAVTPPRSPELSHQGNCGVADLHQLIFRALDHSGWDICVSRHRWAVSAHNYGHSHHKLLGTAALAPPIIAIFLFYPEVSSSSTQLPRAPRTPRSRSLFPISTAYKGPS